MTVRGSVRPLIAAVAVLAVLVTGVIVGTASPAPATAAPVGGPVKAAVASNFDPGYIISDYNFYSGQALSVSAIQTFLNSKVSSCRAGYTCLKDYAVSTTSRAGDAMCGPYTGAANETAATIVYKVGVACGISQKVLLVLLEKEQSLVTDDWPTTGQYMKATGYACPDTSACDTQYYGFYNQVYMAAWQYKRYGNPPGTSNAFTWFPVGQTTAVRYSPDATCGSSPVFIRNAATAALYYYTPYQPNAAALANLYGTGDACSAYGNRNFWRLYTDWFGPTNASVPPIGNYESAALGSTTFTVAGWAIDQSVMNAVASVQITWNTPAGVSTTTVAANGTRPDVGNAYPSAGAAHGFSASVPRSGDGQYSACVTALALPQNPAGNADFGCRTVFFSTAAGGTPATSRLQGSDRFTTSTVISQAAYPTPGVPVVYIASGIDFPDAISAAPAAAAQKGPLLLSMPGGLPAATLAEVKRLAPKKIVVVGGTSSITDGVYATLAGIQPNIVRVAGGDRFETSRALAAYAFPAAKGAYFASGLAFPDALSAASAAAATNQPVILVTGYGAADAPTSSYVTTAKLTSATIVGGVNAIAPAFDTSLQAIGAAPTRVGGGDRYDTSHIVNSRAFPTASTVYIASGIDFPDALSGSTIAGGTKSPLFITPGWCLPRAIGNDIVTMRSTKVVFIGGTTALAPDVASFKPC
ncbi:cell wall-binding repeat-containing protein [Leifsonia shinshuensis]